MGRKITLENLKDFCEKALVKEGMNAADAKVTAEVLATTDALGTHSHGTKNLFDYFRKVEAGGMKLNADVKVVSDAPAVATIDGDCAFGMVPAYKAMMLAIEKAKITGIAAVLVKNTSHFGAAGFYPLLAARENMIGMICSNVDSNMGIPGAKGKVLGNSPFSYAVPSGDKDPVFLDIAMSTVASLKVVQARKDGKQIPPTWITDKDGLPTSDPSHYPEQGAMAPMAGHKGYGLSLLVEILTGVLGGGGVMGEIPSWLFSMDTKNNVSHLCIVIDPAKFVGADAFNHKMENVVDDLHSKPLAKGTERIYAPGEIEWGRYHKAMSEGVDIPDDVAANLEKLEKKSGIKIEWKE